MKNRDEKVINLSALSREELERQYVQLHTEYESAMTKLQYYQEQLATNRRKMFGQSSEKDIAGQMSSDDLMLFNEAEALGEPLNIEAKPEKLVEKASRKPKGKKDTRKLHLVVDTYELTVEEQVCPECGAPLHEMKTVERVEIELVPARTIVHKYVSKMYACRECEDNGSATIITAPGAPRPLLDKSLVSPSVAADIICKKYVDALPFYRQEQNFVRAGIPIDRNNMCNWSIKLANLYIKPVVERMQSVLYAEPAIHCDETTTEVLQEPGRKAATSSYIWVTTTTRYQKDHPIAIS